MFNPPNRMTAAPQTTTLHCLVCLTATAAMLVSTPARADDDTAQRLLTTAADAYARRAESADVPGQVLSTLAQAEAEAQDAELKYAILELESRVLYWQGTHATRDAEGAVFHLAGRQKADAAAMLLDTYAEAFYYAGLNQYFWAHSQGIVEFQTRSKIIVMDYMQKASDLSRLTRDGEDGESVEGYGPDRIIGRLYGKLWGVLGGDYSLAVSRLETAVQRAPGYALNIVYLAEILLRGNTADKTRAKALLTELLTQDPVTYGARFNRVPETIDEFEMARMLLNGQPIP